MVVLPGEKIISEAMQTVYRKWQRVAKRQKRINWKKRGQEIEQEIEDIEKILEGGERE
ncbi:hypothetical protein ES703_16291 [subsurface metagenome]